MNTSTTPDQANADEARFLAPETHQRAGGESKAEGKARKERAGAVEDDGELRYVSLDRLVLSPFNVRKSGGENIDELASLIASQGLLQNLVVVPHTTKKGKATGRFEVVAGGRRLRALVKLAQIGTLATDEQVLCKIVSPEGAVATSAAENSGREPMSAADTVQAFADMVNGGATVEEVSVCFGITPMTVRRRLKLAAVSPRLFALFREGDVSLDQMMALAVTDDHGRQEAAWDGTTDWNRQPQVLRRLLIGESRPLAHPTVRFVGLAAYEAAGGAVVRDLFAQDEDESGYIANSGLLDLLVTEKLAGIAGDVKREGWSWTETVQTFGWSDRNQFREARPGRRAPTDGERASIEQLTKRRDDAAAAIDTLYGSADEAGGESESEPGGVDDSEEKAHALEQEVEDAEAALHEIHASMEIWSAEVMAHAGAVVSIGRAGEAEVVRGLVKPEDREQARAAQANQRRTTGEDGGGDNDEGDRYSDSGARGLDVGTRAKGKGEFSEPLMRRLTAHRTKALQLLVAGNAQVALAALTHTMMQQVLGSNHLPRASSSLDVTVRSCESRLPSDADDMEASPAWAKLRQRVDAWGERLPGGSDELLPWLIHQPQETLVELLALCTALSLDAVCTTRGPGTSDAIAAAVGLDMADWWTPTARAFLAHVPKSKIAEAVQEAVSAGEAQKLAKLKKAEAVVKAEGLLAGTRWLPAPLRAKAD